MHFRITLLHCFDIILHLVANIDTCCAQKTPRYALVSVSTDKHRQRRKYFTLGDLLCLENTLICFSNTKLVSVSTDKHCQRRKASRRRVSKQNILWLYCIVLYLYFAVLFYCIEFVFCACINRIFCVVLHRICILCMCKQNILCGPPVLTGNDTNRLKWRYLA